VLLFLFAVIVIYFSKKKEIEFLLAAVLFTYGSGTVQNRNFGAVAGEVILVNSCAVIFICCDCYLFF